MLATMGAKQSQGVLILVLGILGFVGCGCLTGIPAWIMGNSALAAIDRGEMDGSDRTLVQVGRILGMIATILAALGLLAWILMVAGILALGATTSTPIR